jgi:hypothetical protein
MERPIDGLLNAIANPTCNQIHFVDIENLAGTGLLNSEKVSEICASYSNCVPCGVNDLFLVAAGPQNKLAIFEGWAKKGSFYQFRKGKDGADHALLAIFESIENLQHYKKVFLATGDGGLLRIVEQSLSAGISVTLVTGKGKTNQSLRRFPSLKLRATVSGGY